MDAAAELIAEQGLARTTVDQIAARADIAQTTFFNYFPAKADLVDALVERMVDRLTGAAPEVGAPVAQRIVALFRASAELSDDHRRVLRDGVADAVRSPSSSAGGGFGRLRALFAEEIATAQARGEVRGDRHPGPLADAVLGIYVAAMLFAGPDADQPAAERLLAGAQLALDLVGSRVADPVPLTT